MTNQTVAVETQELAARLEAGDPTLKNCYVVVIVVSGDGTFDMVSNVPPDKLDELFAYAIEKRTGTGTPIRPM